LRSPVPFFLLTFAVAWACWIPVVRGIPDHAPLGVFLLYLGTFAPSLVAISLTARAQGNTGVRELFGRILRGPVAGRWFVFALTYMLTLKLVAAVIHRVAFGAWPRFQTAELFLIPFVIATSTVGQVGEELGWRGYALPRMADRMGLAAASVVLGVIWAVWHLPLFFVRGADTFHQSFPVYALGVIAISVAIAWVYTNTRAGLLLPMLLHAAVNNTKDIVPAAVPIPPGTFSFAASRISWITAALLWTCALAMLAWMIRTEPRRAEREAPA
jgi:membrane protease YdiL (CAAX protease family)